MWRKDVTTVSCAHAFTHSYVYGFEDYPLEQGEFAARIRTAELGLAVQLFRLDKGQLPEDMDELIETLMSEIPTDPFDGKLLRYRRWNDSGYAVYSIGPNGIDDSGQRDDIAFLLER